MKEMKETEPQVPAWPRASILGGFGHHGGVRSEPKPCYLAKLGEMTGLEGHFGWHSQEGPRRRRVEVMGCQRTEFYREAHCFSAVAGWRTGDNVRREGGREDGKKEGRRKEGKREKEKKERKKDKFKHQHKPWLSGYGASSLFPETQVSRPQQGFLPLECRPCPVKPPCTWPSPSGVGSDVCALSFPAESEAPRGCRASYFMPGRASRLDTGVSLGNAFQLESNKPC